jgi:hypothetical protein
MLYFSFLISHNHPQIFFFFVFFFLYKFLNHGNYTQKYCTLSGRAAHVLRNFRCISFMLAVRHHTFLNPTHSPLIAR